MTKLEVELRRMLSSLREQIWGIQKCAEEVGRGPGDRRDQIAAIYARSKPFEYARDSIESTLLACTGAPSDPDLDRWLQLGGKLFRGGVETTKEEVAEFDRLESKLRKRREERAFANLG